MPLGVTRRLARAPGGPLPSLEMEKDKRALFENFREKWKFFEKKISGILLGISVTLAFYEVLSRYFLHTSIDWSEEIVLYSMAWSAFFGSSVLIKEDGHVRVTVIMNMFRSERRDLLHFLNTCLCLLFTIVVTYSGILQVHDAYLKRIISESTLKIPFWIPYLATPVGGAIMSLSLSERLLLYIPRIRLRQLLMDAIFYSYIFLCLSLLILLHLGCNATLVLVLGLLILLCAGMPIAFALGLTCLGVLYLLNLLPLTGVAPKMFESITKFSYLAIPFFILSGAIMTRGGIAEPLLNFAYEALRPLKGGFAIAVMVACIIFSALSGASAAIAAALGMIAIPGLIQRGYPKKFALGLISSGGTLGVLIPPSTILILYGAVSGESIADLFKAGIAPGLVVGFALCFLIYLISRTKGYGVADEQKTVSAKSVAKGFLDALWAILMPIIILGGIYSGFFTPTEAAAVAVFYGVAVCTLTYEKIGVKQLFAILEESAKFSAMIYFIIMTATLFGFLVTMEQLSLKLLNLITMANIKPWLFLLIVNISVFIMGCFLSPGSIILMIVPLLHPLLDTLGIDPVHFGILLTINMELAFITPPFGMNLFVVSGVAKEPVIEVVKGELPFLFLLLASLLVITYFPDLTLLFVK